MNKKSSPSSNPRRKRPAADNADRTGRGALRTQHLESQDNADDEQTAARAAKGDAEAFGELFDKYRRPLFRVVWRMLNNEDAALDVVQDAFVKAYENLGGLKGGGRFYPWLRRIAVNMAVDRLRRRKRLRHVPLADGEAEEEAGGGFTPTAVEAGRGSAEENDPARQAEMSEFRAAYQQALTELSDEHRVVFTLHAAEGLRYREIAEALGINIGTVMSRLFYARKRLQELLAPYLEQRSNAGAAKDSEDSEEQD